MTISTGDKIPSVTLRHMTPDGPAEIATQDIFTGKKVVLFAVPGAFTPGCSMSHLPGFVDHVDQIKAKGVDTVACIAVNDAFVMHAWGEAHKAEGIQMLADPDGEFARAVGLAVDLSQFGLGMRSARYALVVDDGVVTSAHIEPEGGITVSAASAVLEHL
ncbi:MAG: peroxiredoxin [Gammaproteobacteria bacterium]|nr:peroxiredoxin [Gammaproteobacteria bacterium]